MSCLFGKCSSLKKIPDISLWNTSNVLDIGGLFYNCLSLEELPYLSKWNTNKVIIMNSIFYGCKKIEFIPDISKWNIDKVINISLIFCDCHSLKTLPDISKWNIYNLNLERNIFDLFEKFKIYYEDMKLLSELMKSFSEEKDELNINMSIGMPKIDSFLN